MCGMRITRDTWWWNEEVRQAASRKKDAHKVMYGNSTGEYEEA